VDDPTGARGRSWALWKGLVMMTNKPPGQAEFARHVLDELFSKPDPASRSKPVLGSRLAQAGGLRPSTGG